LDVGIPILAKKSDMLRNVTVNLEVGRIVWYGAATGKGMENARTLSIVAEQVSKARKQRSVEHVEP
jgi:hypothetical protein